MALTIIDKYFAQEVSSFCIAIIWLSSLQYRSYSMYARTYVCTYVCMLPVCYKYVMDVRTVHSLAC